MEMTLKVKPQQGKTEYIASKHPTQVYFQKREKKVKFYTNIQMKDCN